MGSHEHVLNQAALGGGCRRGKLPAIDDLVLNDGCRGVNLCTDCRKQFIQRAGGGKLFLSVKTKPACFWSIDTVWSQNVCDILLQSFKDVFFPGGEFSSCGGVVLKFDGHPTNRLNRRQ